MPELMDKHNIAGLQALFFMVGLVGPFIFKEDKNED